ncbi:AAA family ATPase [Clostridium sp.]|uniref:AAA family ATPase n=1 Tax=Clostridium sp. TaxID=1506 RepID=UPI0026DAF1A5|nr:AAA family ATPase [Clostridium sp.]MDO5039360.1 AAA family ATPase [Clostridium sp.]
MRYSDTLSAAELVMSSNDVPLIIGESGIGKTALAREIAKRNNYVLITIDANLLKEGEIGGLPTVVRGRTVYATYDKLSKVSEIIENGRNVLLFIDELNRCEHAVQQELMNLILNREINGYNLPEEVKIIAAMNPSNKYDNYRDSEYAVVDMDPAQEDRFVWLDMEVDVKEWIKWAMSKDGNIDEDIIEFISTFPEYLNTPNSNESIKATPRSYERVSKAYKVYKNNKERYSFDVFLSTVKGNLGVNISTDFASFIKNKKKPMLKPEEIFKFDILPENIKERIFSENSSRLYILAKSSLLYLEGLDEFNSEVSIFGEVLRCYPRDLRLGIMKEIKHEGSKRVYEALLDTDEFLEAFFDIYA